MAATVLTRLQGLDRFIHYRGTYHRIAHLLEARGRLSRLLHSIVVGFLAENGAQGDLPSTASFSLSQWTDASSFIRNSSSALFAKLPHDGPTSVLDYARLACTNHMTEFACHAKAA